MEKIRKILISESNLKKLINVGQGAFATVLADKDNKVVIKRYHEYVKGDYWDTTRNPCLNIKWQKYKRLNSRDKKIKYTDTFVELVYEGSRFIGVQKRFYEGESLDKIGNRTLAIKKDILKKLIRNAKELTFHRIYNLDYKSDNCLVTNKGEVKILDLDDIWTKVTLFPNPIYEEISRKKLQRTIINIIYDYQPYLPSIIAEKITNCPENNPKLQRRLSYKKLTEYVESINFEKKIIVININDLFNLDINSLKYYMEENNLVLVLAIDIATLYLYEKVKEIFSYIDEQNICVYDVFKFRDNYEEARQNYVNSHETTDLHVYDNGFKVLKKK